METVSPILNLLFRWIHVIAGVMWIGHLWFFNFVNAQLAKTYDADSKKKVVPELMPRALYFFRWGAAYTWITGFLLLGIVYYMAPGLSSEGSTLGTGAASGIGVASLIVGFGIYDMLWKSPLGKNEMAAAAVSFVLLVATAFGLSHVLSGRALFIHIGSLFGTIMAANVWMRIWPAQRKIIGGIKGTSPAPDASVAATAGLRSKHNTYLSIPLLFLMVSNHYAVINLGSFNLGYGNTDFGWAIIGLFVAAGWGIAKFIYTKSASDAPKFV